MLWPNNITPSGLEWRLQKSGVQHRSQFTGAFVAHDFLGEFWDITLSLHGEGAKRINSAALDAMLMYLSGGRNQVSIYHWVRPFPAGTLRGSPTMAQVTTRGDAQLILNTTTGMTLRAGDLLGAGTQVFMVQADCIAVNSMIFVPVVNRARGVIADDSAVIWNRPTVNVVCPEMSGGLVYQPGMTLPTQLHLIEP